MVRKYSTEEVVRTRPPRLIISMNIYNDVLRMGFNQHYSLDTPIAEALADFFITMINFEPKCKVDIKKSKLEFRYIDLPKE